MVNIIEKKGRKLAGRCKGQVLTVHAMGYDMYLFGSTTENPARFDGITLSGADVMSVIIS
ncbi:hypothetical protein GCM10027592_44730 [Spirosoma flavus]